MRPGRAPEEITRTVEGHDWWHTIEVGAGIVTRGGWDLRAIAGDMPWPEPMAGRRCLDIGTMDGFWAFEMEDRGAAEVVASDLSEPLRAARFAAAARLRGSRATYLDVSVYDLTPERVGRFDLVFVGYVVEMLADPLLALAAVRSVCTDAVIVLDEIDLWLSRLRPTFPLARLSARPGDLEYFVFNRRGLQRALQLTGFRVDATSPFLRDPPGPKYDPATAPLGDKARRALGLLGRAVAVRGRVT